MTFLYFGYGSNMLTERLRARCPGAKCVSTAEVIDYALEFSKPSVDGSGKATLGHLEGRNQTSIGVVFEKAVDALGKAGVDDYRRLLAPQSAVRLPGESRP